MKKDEIKLGATYLAKVSDQVVPVRVDAENRQGGWNATNLRTGKTVRIQSAQRLRCPANRNGTAQAEPEVQGPTPDATSDVPVAEAVAPTTTAKSEKKARKRSRAGLGMNNTDEPPTPEAAAAVESSTGETPPVETPAAEVGQTEPTAPPAAEPVTADEPPAQPTIEANAPGQKLSAIDAAAKVLGEEGRPMTCQEMIDLMAAKGYWHSPGGKTPSATLYSSILREQKVRGTQTRFVKAGRGKVTWNR